MVAFARVSPINCLNERQQAALRVTRLEIGIYRNGELMVGRLGPNAIQGLVVFDICLAPDGVANPRLRQQVPFIGGIYEHRGAIDLAVLHFNLRNTPAFLPHRSEPLLEIDGRLGLIEHLEQDVLGHMRLEGPQGGLRGTQLAQCRCPSAVREILLARLPAPGVAARIVQRHAVIEFARDAADGGLVADVGRAEPAGSQPAQVFAELGDDRGFAHARRLHRRRHSARRGPVNAQVGFDDLAGIQIHQRRETDKCEPEAKRQRCPNRRARA